MGPIMKGLSTLIDLHFNGIIVHFRKGVAEFSCPSNTRLCFVCSFIALHKFGVSCLWWHWQSLQHTPSHQGFQRVSITDAVALKCSNVLQLLSHLGAAFNSSPPLNFPLLDRTGLVGESPPHTFSNVGRENGSIQHY